jgi:hypothetical protein
MDFGLSGGAEDEEEGGLWATAPERGATAGQPASGLLMCSEFPRTLRPRALVNKRPVDASDPARWHYGGECGLQAALSLRQWRWTHI